MYLKCKKCGKVYIQGEDNMIVPAGAKPKECEGGCMKLVSTSWVEKVIDVEEPK